MLVAAAGARAESPHPAAGVTADNLFNVVSSPDQPQWGPQPAHKLFQWDQKGHWGLKLDLSEPIGRDMQLRDVEAGAYFHVTPKLRIGGSVSLGDSSLIDRTMLIPQQSQAPRVKLETSFKF